MLICLYIFFQFYFFAMDFFLPLWNEISVHRIKKNMLRDSK